MLSEVVDMRRWCKVEGCCEVVVQGVCRGAEVLVQSSEVVQRLWWRGGAEVVQRWCRCASVDERVQMQV